jgi:hypothetical protein
MRKLGTVIFLLVLAVVLALALANHRAHPAGKRVYGYHESASDGTNEPVCFFLVGDFKGGLHMGPCGIGEAVNWSYHIFLSGAGERFPFEKVDVRPDGLGWQERPVAGEVLLDRKKSLVMIALKVVHGKDMEDFIGNGTFDLKKWP